MAVKKQSTIDGSSPAMDATEKPKTTKKTSGNPRITMRSLDEKYSMILAALRENSEKMDDVIMAVGNAPAQTVQSVQNPAHVQLAEPREDLVQYLTSREQFEGYQKVINRRDGEFADKRLMHLLEQICMLREDFNKLCSTLQTKIESFSATEVLSSFRAYAVDIENILTDAGVKFGTFGAPGSQVNTDHQRIVSVLPTTDPSRNGTVAQRISNGYQYQERTIVKEKVTVYKSAAKKI